MTAATPDKYAVTSWNIGPALEDVRLSSGQLVQVKKITMERIVMLGLVNALDSFQAAMAEVSKKTKGKKKKLSQEEEDAEFMMVLFRNPEEFSELMKTVDRCIVETVVQPKIYPVPFDANGVPDDAARVEGVVYVDSVSFEDKMELFGRVSREVGGIDNFREGSSDDLGTVDQKPEAANVPVAVGGDTV